jgi:competence protein ComEA
MIHFRDSKTLTAVGFLTLVLISPGCVRRQYPGTSSLATDQQSTPNTEKQISPRININTASANELETLPGIGKGLAARIVEHREKFGPFRRPEHLLIVRGISDRRFRALRDSITVE